MDTFIDHYIVLGLPSGEKGFKVTQNEITKAYKSKALELHPDKRPNDSNAVIEFRKLQSSYQVLKYETSRRAFNAELRVKQDSDIKKDRIMSKRRVGECGWIVMNECRGEACLILKREMF